MGGTETGGEEHTQLREEPPIGWRKRVKHSMHVRASTNITSSYKREVERTREKEREKESQVKGKREKP